MLFKKKSAAVGTASLGLRCSFCNKKDDDVRKLIAGPTVFICDECIRVCNDILADDTRSAMPMPAEPPDPALERPPASTTVIACAMCQTAMPLDEAVPIEKRGFLCAGCTGEVEAAIARQRESTSWKPS